MSEPQPRDIGQPVVGLLNLMPYASIGKTQDQWAELLGAELQVKFDDDPRVEAGCRSVEYLARCVPFSDAADSLDAVVVTGANLELAQPDNPFSSSLLPLDEISYLGRLHDVIDWSIESEKLAIYSCLASHIALNYLFGLERERGVDKTFGVYEHEVYAPGSGLVEGFGDRLRAPHSRWGDIPAKLLEDCGVEVIAANEEVGWLVARYGNSIFLQGHPEYSANDLAEEYHRDVPCSPRIPENYFSDNNPEGKTVFSWDQDRKVLFENIRSQIE